jgi:putative heme-binding domain-containing protein
LANARPRQLVAELDSAKAWRRDTAFRLLIEANDRSVASTLKKSFAKLASPAGASLRLHLLASLDELDEKMLVAGLRSPFAGVREAALRLAEARLKQSPDLDQLVLKLVDDSDARVRFQCALSLGPAHRQESIGALARIALRGIDDRWTRAAVLSSVPERENGQLPLLSTFLASGPDESEGAGAFLRELSRMATSTTPAGSLSSFLDWLLRQSANASFVAQAALVGGFADAARSVGGGYGDSILLRSSSRSVEELMRSAREISFQRAAGNASDGRRATSQPCGSGIATEPLLAAAHKRSTSTPGRGGSGAGRTGRSAPVAALLEASLWRRFSPACREAVIASVLSRPRHHAALLSAVESGAVPLSSLDSNRRDQLKKSKDEAIRERANHLFVVDKASDRMRAFDEAKSALSLKPVPANGHEVFKRACANCHRLDGEGYAVGPDLFDIRNQSKESILLHLVIPEAEIAPNFASYTCEKKDGSVVSGILIADTPASITLRQGLGIEEVIARSEIADLAASSVSLMPQDLLTSMTQQDLADLLAYLRGER